MLPATARGVRVMDKFIARANVDHFLDLLDDQDIPADSRSTINKLLLEEVNKLSPDTEHLEFVEGKAARYRLKCDRLCRWRDGFTDGSPERLHADNVVASFRTTLQLLGDLCSQMRRQVNGDSL
jgi:hypothetical protein